MAEKVWVKGGIKSLGSDNGGNSAIKKRATGKSASAREENQEESGKFYRSNSDSLLHAAGHRQQHPQRHIIEARAEVVKAKWGNISIGEKAKKRTLKSIVRHQLPSVKVFSGLIWEIRFKYPCNG